MTDYRLDISAGVPRELARYWLGLGIAALIGAGLLAILLVMSRTPGIQNVFPLRDFFRSALVVHVDLSVLIWFMAFAAVLWSLAGDGRLAALGRAGFAFAAAGTTIMTVSPFFPNAQPLLNNYIPVLQQPVFFTGLGLAGSGFAMTLLRALATIEWRAGWKVMSPTGMGTVSLADGADEAPAQPDGAELDPARVAADSGTAIVRLAIGLSALAGALAIAAVGVSLLQAPPFEGQAYWEAIFWGGGHTLQFQHTLLMIVAWFWLACELQQLPPLGPRPVAMLFGLAATPLLAVPVIYALTDVGSGWHVAYFARLMEFGHPLMLPLIAIAAVPLWRLRHVRAPAKSAFAASFALFAAGGILAYLIKGVNVVIPAHYHGSIVGVTLAFMGLAFVLLPRLGFSAVSGKMAHWQPYVYGGGQLLHIVGLAWSGGYGVQRKVAGAEQVLTTLPQQIGMGMMGLGGLISVIGGVMFVLVCLKAMSKKPEAA